MSIDELGQFYINRALADNLALHRGSISLRFLPASNGAVDFHYSILNPELREMQQLALLEVSREHKQVRIFSRVSSEAEQVLNWFINSLRSSQTFEGFASYGLSLKIDSVITSGGPNVINLKISELGDLGKLLSCLLNPSSLELSPQNEQIIFHPGLGVIGSGGNVEYVARGLGLTNYITYNSVIAQYSEDKIDVIVTPEGANIDSSVRLLAECLKERGIEGDLVLNWFSDEEWHVRTVNQIIGGAAEA